MTATPDRYQSPRGTHDRLPDQMPAWRKIEDTFRALCELYHFEEIVTPAFESTDLFTRTAGEASDIIVTKQMYTFTAPDGLSYTLRPEGTAPAVRAYLQNRLNERGPVAKLFYVGPIFRYEAPQAGRYRQHFQCGVEMLGAPGPEADVEIVALGHQFLSLLQVPAELHLNSIGTAASRRGYQEQLRAFLEPHRARLSADSQRRLEMNPLRIFDSKVPGDQELLEGAPHLLDYLREADPDSYAHFTQVCALLGDLDIPYTLNHRLVRGFDYYSRTAFEFVSGRLGAQSTVLGGGRYDGLVEELGGDPTPGVGFGCGMERLREASTLEWPGSEPVQIWIATRGEAARRSAVRLLADLRARGWRVDADYAGRSLKAQMKEAGRQGALCTVLLGEDELAAGTVTVRDMLQGTQETVPRATLFNWLPQHLLGLEGDGTAPLLKAS